MTNKGLLTYLLVIIAVLFLFTTAPLLRAKETDARLESITFHQKSSTEETVTFKLNGPHLPKIFALKGTAPRIVFDFYDISPSPSIKATIENKGNLITAIRTGKHTDEPPKTRVVLDLAPAGEYDFSQDFEKKENTLRITVFRTRQPNDKAPAIQPGEKEKQSDGTALNSHPPLEAKEVKQARPETEAQKKEPLPAASPSISEKQPTVAPSSTNMAIHAIAFEKTADKADKVSFKIDNFNPPAIFGIEEGTPRIVCDFTNAVLTDKIPAVIPTKGEFVKEIRVEKDSHSSTIRMVLELAPNRHYDLQQIYYKEDQLYVLLVNSSDRADNKSNKKL